MEALGYASMAELPLIVVNVQRGGPSTGLPTSVEQSDLMATYLTRHEGANLAAAVFGGSLLAMALLFFAFQHQVLRKEHLLQDRITPDARERILRRNAMGLVPYAVATAGASISPYLTLVVTGVVAGFYALPTTTSD